jgi:hypothetical protein
MMKNKTLAVGLISAVFLLLMFISTINPQLTYAQDQKFKANLNAEDEVPPVTSAADGKVKIKVKGDTIRSEINVTGIEDVTGAHIYTGNKGENGEPIVDLLKSGNESNVEGRIIIQGEITTSDFEGSMAGKTLTDLQSAMAAEGTYVNILTADHPDGEIRGQIKVSGSNATKTESMDASATLEAEDG